MNFILYNSIFEKIILCLIFLNILIKGVDLVWKFVKSKKNIIHYLFIDDEIETNYKFTDKFLKFVIIYLIILFFALYIFFVVLLKTNEFINAAFILIGIIASFVYTMIDIFKKNVNVEKKILFYIFGSLLFFFFSSESMNVILKYNYSKYLKELIILLAINFKIIFFIFIVLINFNVLMFYINKFLQLFINVKKNSKQRKYFIIKRQFDLNKKFKGDFIISCMLFTILFPFFIIFTICKNICTKILKTVINLINKINLIYTNSSYILLKLIKISIILSLTISNIIVFYNNIFSEKLSDTFTFVSTVILIPLIYDQIKKDSIILNNN